MQYLWKKDRSAMTGLTKDQQFRLAAEQAAKDIKAEATKKQQRVALTILAHDRIKTHVENYLPGKQQEALSDILSGNKTMSVESLNESIRHQVLSSIDEVSKDKGSAPIFTATAVKIN